MLFRSKGFFKWYIWPDEDLELLRLEEVRASHYLFDEKIKEMRPFPSLVRLLLVLRS